MSGSIEDWIRSVERILDQRGVDCSACRALLGEFARRAADCLFEGDGKATVEAGWRTGRTLRIPLALSSSGARFEACFGKAYLYGGDYRGACPDCGRAWRHQHANPGHERFGQLTISLVTEPRQAPLSERIDTPPPGPKPELPIRKRHPEEVLMACVESALGERLEITSDTNRGEPHVLREGRYWETDPYSGGASDVILAVKGMPVTLALNYSEHSESGQIDTWFVTHGGFEPAQRDALLDALDPYLSVFNLNRNARCRHREKGDRDWSKWAKPPA
ncbi:MAG: hypothetical protein AB8I08_39490 [Sandaracinaceae bacterium]